jgi:hypothetical protein
MPAARVSATFATFVVAALLGSAAARLIGSSYIQPAHLLLSFVVATVLRHSRETARAIDDRRPFVA